MTTRSRFVIAALAASIFLPAFAPAEARAQAPAAGAPAAAPAFDAEALARQAIAGLRGRLQLTDDQAARIQPLLAEHMTKLRQVLTEYARPTGVESAALLEDFRAQRAGFQAHLEPILSPAQVKEMAVIRKEVDQQLKETICATRLREMAVRLSLKPDQEKPVGAILCEDFQKKLTLVAGMTTSAGPAARKPATPHFQQIQDETEARLRQALTPEQMKTYEIYREELRTKAGQAGT